MRPEIIAELSCNHLGVLADAMTLVDAAAEAGADAIKLQVWHPDRMVMGDHTLQDGPWAGRNLKDLYKEAETPWHWVQPLFDRARRGGIQAFASVFDTAALTFLEDIGCPRYKIASFELVDTPLIEAVARAGKPMIISTGMASMAEIACAVTAAKDGCGDLTLLHCVSAYPTPPAEANLSRICTLQEQFACRIGLSDHSQGTAVAVAATALGVTMIEKHFTLLRANGGPDAAFSLEPDELKQLVTDTRAAYDAVHTPPDVTTSEAPQRALRRSLYFSQDIKAGDTITQDHLTTARPFSHRYPYEIQQVIGTTCQQDRKRGDPVT